MEQSQADRPEVMHVEVSDLVAALRVGWRDFRTAPQYGLLFACIYVIGGWLIYFALTGTGRLWWTLAAAAGFPILGPFIACGLYDVSRRLEAGLPMDRHATLLVIFRQKDRQIPLDGGGDCGVLSVLEFPVTHDLRVVSGQCSDDQCVVVLGGVCDARWLNHAGGGHSRGGGVLDACCSA